MKKVLLLVLLVSLANLLSAQELVMHEQTKTDHPALTATEDVLWEQLTSSADEGYGFLAQTFPDFDDARIIAADDFVVPEGYNWDITNVDIYGFHNTATSAISVNLYFYADDNGAPGEELYAFEGITDVDLAEDDYPVELPSAINLVAGTYWLGVSVEKTYGTGDAWYWLRVFGQNGSNGMFVDEEQLFGATSTGDWQDVDFTNAPNDKDFAFALSGTANLPVELTSFAAVSQGSKVVLNWETATEINNHGFSIERQVEANGQVSEWTTVAFKEGFGTSQEMHSYSYTDNVANLNADAISYRLKQLDFDGSFEYSDVVSVEELVPAQFVLNQNYPNPFNPSTAISFALPVDSKVNVKVYNTLGQEIATLTNQTLAAGNHTVNFNAANLVSGLYIYRFEAKGADGSQFVEMRKMTLLK